MKKVHRPTDNTSEPACEYPWCVRGNHGHRDHSGESIAVPATADPTRFSPDFSLGGVVVPMAAAHLAVDPGGPTVVRLNLAGPDGAGGHVDHDADFTLAEAARLRDSLTALLEEAR